MTKTRRAGLLTVLYLGFIAYLRGSEVWGLLREGGLNVLGDFLAGAFTPLAFLWLVVGYFLQKDEFQLQNEELGLQRKELEQARGALSSQVKIMERQADAERRRVMPYLHLEKDKTLKENDFEEENPSGERQGSEDPSAFVLRNSGGPARNLEITLSDGGRKREEWPLLDTDKTDSLFIRSPFSFDFFSNPDDDQSHDQSHGQPYYCKVRFTSERHERFQQGWSIRFNAQDSSVVIDDITDGPTQLT